ncbi:hypothetical protein [Pantoea rodasii]|uniref:hypothetical protein n=1 Tax=Pantoea rodasii TaxID=1076549 RepID=UPI001301F639|nr:hypothetical protein [Pantoea rodasii]
MKKIDVIFCAVSNGIIENSYIKPGKSILRLCKALWTLITAPNAKDQEKRKFNY